MSESELTSEEYKLIFPYSTDELINPEIPFCYTDLLIFGVTLLPFIGKAWEWYSKS